MTDFSKHSFGNDSFFEKLNESLDTPAEKEDVYKFLSLDEIIATDYPKEQYFVERLIPKDAITCIGGLPATMKSYFSNYLALRVVSGKDVLGLYKTEPANILFIDKENKLSRIKDRFLRLGIGSNEAKKIFYLSSNFIIDNDHDLSASIAFIKDHNIKLTFLDTLVRVHNHEENSASEMNKVFLALKELLLAGSAVCFLHHFNKRGAFGQATDVKDQLRGSGDILAMVDSFIALTRRENMVEVEQAKSRDELCVPKFLMQPAFEETKTSFTFVRQIEADERIESIFVGDKILSALSQNSYTRKFIINSLESPSCSVHTIDRAIAQLKKEGKIIAFTNGNKEYMYGLNKNLKLDE